MRMHKVEKLSFLPSYVTAFAVLVYRLAYNDDIVAFKMGRRLRCLSVTYRSRYARRSRLAGGPF